MQVNFFALSICDFQMCSVSRFQPYQTQVILHVQLDMMKILVFNETLVVKQY